jgi:hypothetical protein
MPFSVAAAASTDQPSPMRITAAGQLLDHGAVDQRATD